MLLPPEAIQQAYDFKMDTKRFGYDTSFKELSFSKGNKNYNRILKKLEEITLPDPSIFTYSTLTLDELKSLLSEIMIKILGEHHTSEIEYLNSLLYPTRTSEMFDSILEEEIVGHDFIPKRIHINRQLATIQVASTGHEYIHALLSKYKGHNFNKVLTNIHYNELLSILTEYIIIYELSQMLKTVLQVAADGAGICLPTVEVQPMENKNWLVECYQSFKPIQIGKYYIYGSHIDEMPPVDLISLKIDAATAFGTGEHQTTHGCLTALNDLDFEPEKVIDVGCGSGILSMAYAKTFNKKVDAVDIDPESVRVATNNAKINGLDGLMNVWLSNGYESVSETYDLVLCNILARPLMDMASDLKKHLNTGGLAILSGFLTRQERWVLKAHTDIGFEFVKRYRINGWSTLVVKKV